MTDETPGLERLAHMARSRTTLMASLMARYQAQAQLDDAALAAFLQAGDQTLTRLALCRRPRMSDSHFDADVHQIATYAKVDAAQLARLVRAATAEEAQTMQTAKHQVHFPYRLEELRALFALAKLEDVDNGGRYDARRAAINIWTHGWHHPETWEESETMGTLYFHWGDAICHLYEIECDEGFAKTDLLRELGILEAKALGRHLHGQ